MRSTRLVTLLILLAGGRSMSLSAQTALPLTPYLEVLRTLKVVVGHDTLDFLLDTGGGKTIISPDLAGRLGCVPGGRATGFRMRGEKVASPTCPGIALEIGHTRIVTEASVFDLMSLIGPDKPRVEGMVSLSTFAGRAVTLDLAAGTLTLETPRSLARRVRGMTPLPARLANGHAGDQLDLVIGLPAGDRTLWFLWDSGHIGPVFLAPHATTLLGLDTTAVRRLAVPLAPGLTPESPYAIRDIIYDGVLGEPLIARAAWTLDLAAGKVWVSGFR